MLKYIIRNAAFTSSASAEVQFICIKYICHYESKMVYNYYACIAQPTCLMELNLTFTLCHSTLSNLWHANCFYFWVWKG